MAASTSSPSLTSLDLLPVLLLDVQTTGASPARGHLLEVAWARGSARAWAKGEPLEVASRRVALPDGFLVPPRIEGLTGIDEQVLADAEHPRRVWEELAGAAREVGSGVAVAHVARFERAFLEDLHAQADDPGPFPLHFLCTHELACRLLPELPRRGLRALAGRLGHPPSELRRAEAHVRATACVWIGLVERLRQEAGVVDEAGLSRYLEEVLPRRRAGRSFAVPRAVRLELPDGPGVYRMLGRGGNVLYVGKATSLKRRVNGYFQKRRHARATVLEMLTQVFDLDVTPTATALEAALLETDEIKRLDPPYNVQLRSRAMDRVFLDPASLTLVPPPHARRGVGPLPRAAAEALAALGTLAADAWAATPAVWAAALGVRPETGLDPALLAAGWEAFQRAHAPAPSRGWTARALLGLGWRLWRLRLAEAALPAGRGEGAEEHEPGEEGGDDPAAPDAEAAAPREGWAPADPEAVGRALERTLLVGAHALRRARLLVRLSECRLTWRPAEWGDRDGARRLVLEGGRVTHAADAPFDAGPPPPGWPRGRGRRARAMDGATLDRMSVFVAETKRLVAGRCDLLCHLGPRRILDRPALAARLAGV